MKHFIVLLVTGSMCFFALFAASGPAFVIAGTMVAWVLVLAYMKGETDEEIKEAWKKKRAAQEAELELKREAEAVKRANDGALMKSAVKEAIWGTLGGILIIATCGLILVFWYMNNIDRYGNYAPMRQRRYHY
jgi:hypothetical protein